MNIKVLGGGCRSCEALLKAAKEAVEKKGIHAEVEYITDMEKIMAYGVMSMPALMIDDKIVSAGKVLKTAPYISHLKVCLGFSPPRSGWDNGSLPPLTFSSWSWLSSCFFPLPLP